MEKPVPVLFRHLVDAAGSGVIASHLPLGRKGQQGILLKTVQQRSLAEEGQRGSGAEDRRQAEQCKQYQDFRGPLSACFAGAVEKRVYTMMHGLGMRMSKRKRKERG